MAATAAVPNGGPYNASFLEGGIGIERTLAAQTPLLVMGARFTMSAWVHPDRVQPGQLSVIAVGSGTASRSLELDDGRLAFANGAQRLVSRASIPAGRWTFVTVTGDGKLLQLYVAGRPVAAVQGAAVAASPEIAIAPPGPVHFAGALVDATVDDRASSALDIAREASAPPDFDLVQMTRVGIGWEWQKQANTGLWQQQDAWTLPYGHGGFSAPVARSVPVEPALRPLADGAWQINGWRLIEAARTGVGPAVSSAALDVGRWYIATVPGTVLTTLVDRGVYPDPYYGLNNLAIPEKLARQDYWYRTSFTVPAAAAGKRLTLRFNGVNYAAEIWANGSRLGSMTGAFIRGDFAFDAVAGENIVAVRVSPPPHPGIPHEQSIAAGVGPNGGQLAIDGPTFVATEGWDWIPGIRDRDTGIWQTVELRARGALAIGDPQVITDLPLPRTGSADVYIDVPVRNDGAARRATVTASFGTVDVRQSVDLPAGTSKVRFAPSGYPALHLLDPALWWPNGYGAPTLQTLHLTVADNAGVSDTRTLRFGIREVSYELSLFDSAGRLRRVDVHTTDGKLRGERLIDVRHEAIKQTPGGWVESLTKAGESSPAVRDVPATFALPHLALRVNGVRIAARGGNWGMDDAMKRSDRKHLEPYFRLEREAHLNIIRNWMGTSTEDVFYDLADENGMMVVNDFWQSTQNFQVEPQDPQLFLANARDVVSRYRNHPSIVIWFGRNEGVPYPLLNEGLDNLIADLDGTRWYTGSSNMVNLQGSGPYNYRPPEGYFTDLASGFSVETGTPSLSTREAVEASVPAADRWPLSDTLAYHDWHFSGNGDTKTFMAALDTMFGAATGFDDFERKAQMMNLETHQAIYEGFLGHLWTKNSGRLLWMSHPAWPSNSWQLYSSDYDTSAAYYGAKRANEPVHVQLNRPENTVVVVNTTRDGRDGLTLAARIVGLDGRSLYTRSMAVAAPANAATPIVVLPLADQLAKVGMAFVELTLTDSAGVQVSKNFYWRGRDEAAYRALDTLSARPLTMTCTKSIVGTERLLTVKLGNRGVTPVLAAKVTLLDARGARVLPAYYSDNYVSLLPGADRSLTVRTAPEGVPDRVTLRGWNVVPAAVRCEG